MCRTDYQLIFVIATPNSCYDDLPEAKDNNTTKSLYLFEVTTPYTQGGTVKVKLLHTRLIPYTRAAHLIIVGVALVKF